VGVELRAVLGTDWLDEYEVLSDIFREEPAKRTLHIAIQAPPPGECLL
jgi:hypothetical protein